MKIVLLTNSGFVGDNNQLKGIKFAIQNRIKEKIEWIEMDESQFDINSHEEGAFVFVSGSHGLLMADKIKNSKPDTKIIWSGHQYFSELDSVENLPDIVALPETAVVEKEYAAIEKKTKLILTTGVSHCVNAESVAEDHARFKAEMLPDHAQFPNQIGIVLAGDAPTADGEMLYFSKENAEALAVNISSFIKLNNLDKADTALMITNGPRTGKHDPETGHPHHPEPHRCYQLDESTKAFVDVLKAQMEKANIFVYDFQFGDLKNGPSAYKPMIKQVADSQTGIWFVPSESTSMVTESSFFLESNKPVIIYHPDSANAVHRAHAEDAVKQGVAIELDTSKKFDFKPSCVKMESAATKIADAFYQNMLLNTKTGISLAASFHAIFNSNSNSDAHLSGSMVDGEEHKLACSSK